MSDSERVGAELFVEGIAAFEQGMGSAGSAMSGLGSVASNIGGGALDAFGGAVSAVGTAVAGTLVAGLVAGASAFVAFGAGVVNGAFEAEQSQLVIGRLGRQLTAMGDSTDITVAQVEALGQSFAGLAGGSDDAVIAIQQIAINSQAVSSEALPGFIQASLDLGAVMGDNAAAANILARAFDQPSSAIPLLRRQHILLTDEQETAIKTFEAAGNEAGALAIIQGVLADATGGAALANTQTLSGAWGVFTGTIGEAFEEIGANFLPIMQTMGEFILSTVVPAVTTLAGGFSTLFGTLLSGGDISSAFTEFGAVVSAVFPGAQELFNTLGTGIETFITFIQTNMPAIQTTIGEVFGSVQQIGGDLAALWSETLGPALGEIFTIIFGQGPSAQEVFTGALDAISQGAQNVAAFIRDPLIPAIEGVTAFIIENLPEWKRQAEEVFTAIGNAITWFNDNVVPVLIEKFNLISAWVVENWPTIQANITTAINTISEVVTRVLTGLAQFWTDHGEQIKTIVTGLWTAVSTAFTVATTAVTGVITGFLDGVKAFWDTWGDDIENIVTVLFENVGRAVDAFALAFQGDWEGFGEKVREAWDALWTAVGETLTKAIDLFLAIDWGGVGTAIAQGIADGLANGASLISQAAMTAAQAAFEAAKGFFGIQSPSKLFREDIAGNITSGFVLGLQEGTADIVKAMGEMTSTAYSGSQRTSERVSMGMVTSGAGVTYNNNVNVQASYQRFVAPPLAYTVRLIRDSI